MNRALAERHAAREQLIALAHGHALALARRLSVRQAAVVGSVARGDFNVWSDVDLVIVADDLPARAPDRLALLMEDRPPRVEVTGFTPPELDEARRRRNRMVLELDTAGVAIDLSDSA